MLYDIIICTVCVIIKGPLSVGSDLGVVELHGVIGGQGNHQAFLVELQQGVLGVFQEQTVVAERGHGDGDLGQEVQILQHRTLVVEDRQIWLFVKAWHFDLSFYFYI